MFPCLLTIDDFPGSCAAELLDYLERTGICAVLFCIGRQLEQSMDLAVAALGKGHELGNHSFSHTSFASLDLTAAREEILSTEDLIDTAYERAGSDRKSRLFRFPYGDKGAGHGLSQNSQEIQKKDDLQSLLLELGFSQPRYPDSLTPRYRDTFLSTDADMFWTFETYDWAIDLDSSPEARSMAKMQAEISHSDEFRQGQFQIILSHDLDSRLWASMALIDELGRAGANFQKPRSIL